ncbi:hypothetical protein [Halarcobacter anaerophilus]|nr:hypothetical protein [Halarcobacter anaerophilus]
MSQYIQYFVPLEDNTFYKDIKALESSTFLVYDQKEFIKKDITK